MTCAFPVDGHLISGSWDGTARVWDVASGACLQVLEGHENGVCVLGLPNGDIVTGSTGRQDEHQNHVGYRVRIWRAGAIVRTLDDHGSAVRSVALVPGMGFVSTSNDGEGEGGQQ